MFWEIIDSRVYIVEAKIMFLAIMIFWFSRIKEINVKFYFGKFWIFETNQKLKVFIKFLF